MNRRTRSDGESVKTKIAIICTLDTKAEECLFLKRRIEELDHGTVVVDVGILGSPAFEPDVPRAEIAKAGGADIGELTAAKDRGRGISAMSRGAAVLVPRLFEEGKLDGVVALGGGGGTSIACSAMRKLPFGIPKLMVSTLAGGDTAGYVGTKDIIMFPSIVDIAGLNAITRGVLRRAAAAISAMSRAETEGREDSRRTIAATMFGNTTPAVTAARRILEDRGYEVVVFPCTGQSGRAMEQLILDGEIAGVLDLTITEWADELVGGVLAAGKERLDAASRTGIPQVVAPGCLDMVNFWKPDSIPRRFKGRKFYQHNPDVTLMRTNVEENRKLGKIIAEKLNRSAGRVAVFLPLQGVSMIDCEGGPFWWPEADAALFASLREHLRRDIPLIELDKNINDPGFANSCAMSLLDMMQSGAPRAPIKE
jgi:uncharacterized protein (UPF0261 family)